MLVIVKTERRALSRRERVRRIQVWVKTHGRCFYCGDPAEVQDHVVPLARGGADDVDNLTPSCVTCNGRKGAKSVEEFRRSERARRRREGEYAGWPDGMVPKFGLFWFEVQRILRTEWAR